MRNGLCHPYQSDKSNCHLRGVGLVLFLILEIKKFFIQANSEDQDQMQ